MASATKFYQFATDLSEKVHNLNSDTLNVGLSNTAPTASTNAVWADITEIGTGNGYSAGGSSAGISLAASGGTVTITGTNVVFTASGGSISAFRYIVLYNTSTSPKTKPLILYWDYGSALTLNNTDSLTIKFNNGASSGTILTVA